MDQKEEARARFNGEYIHKIKLRYYGRKYINKSSEFIQFKER